MKLTPKDMARALYQATRQAPEKDAASFVANLIAAAKARGLERSLRDVLAAMPAAMEEVDAENRVTIESAHEIDDDTADAALKAAGIATENVDVVRRVVPELIGGIRIRTRDGIVDASVRRVIDDLALAFSRPPAQTES